MAAGFYTGTFTPLARQTVKKFRQEAEKSASWRSGGVGIAEIETAYWKGPGHIYGADNGGSLFSDTVQVHYRNC